MYYLFSDNLAKLLKSYDYVWSPTDRAFIRYTSVLYDPPGKLELADSELVVSSPQERLPVRKHLREPMVFVSPMASCRWVGSVTSGVPATYGGLSLFGRGYWEHRQINGLTINVSERTFSWDSSELTPFDEKTDGVILEVFNRDGEPIYPPSLFEPGEKALVADSPRQAEMIIKHILALKL